MYNNLNSDINLTMAASQAFEGILNQVVSSNLNFHLEQSPFSAVIHLKKSVIRNQHGSHLIPPPSPSIKLLQVQSDNYRQAQKIVQLENSIKSLKTDSVKSSKSFKQLQEDLEQEKFQVKVKEEENTCHTKNLDRLSDENFELKEALSHMEKELESVQNILDKET